MLIESKIRRANGTTLTWQGKKYHFSPRQEGGPHVCEVDEPGLITKLLENPGFASAEKKPVAIQSEPADPKPEPKRKKVRKVVSDADDGGDSGSSTD